MARLQLGKQLSDDDVKHIVAFLQTLTGDVPAQFAKAPALPFQPRTAAPLIVHISRILAGGMSGCI